MKKLIVPAILVALTSSCAKEIKTVIGEKNASPYAIIADAPDKDWRDIKSAQTLYITLDGGVVVVEMAPQFAPTHVENTKKLVREGVFDDTNFYRVIDNFVAQGGPSDPEKTAKPKHGKLTIPAEFTVIPKQAFEFTPVKGFDGYAAETGYVNGFAAARSKDKSEYWLTHCYGTVAMGRANEADSGGTELYIVNGNAQRYLDKNTTVFGKVVAGMQHIQALIRSQGLNGEKDLKGQNKILSIKVGSDLKQEDILPLQSMRTNSQSFKALIESRKNRDGEWFLYQHNYIDVCSVVVPVRLKAAKAKSIK